ncbi:MAG: hypothetical protein ACPG4U_10645 [Pseudomonadales bacterium]
MISALATLLVATLWLAVGKLLRRWIRTARGQRNTQVTFAVLMLIFVTPMLLCI